MSPSGWQHFFSLFVLPSLQLSCTRYVTLVLGVPTRAREYLCIYVRVSSLRFFSLRGGWVSACVCLCLSPFALHGLADSSLRLRLAVCVFLRVQWDVFFFFCRAVVVSPGLALSHLLPAHPLHCLALACFLLSAFFFLRSRPPLTALNAQRCNVVEVHRKMRTSTKKTAHLYMWDWNPLQGKIYKHAEPPSLTRPCGYRPPPSREEVRLLTLQVTSLDAATVLLCLQITQAAALNILRSKQDVSQPPLCARCRLSRNPSLPFRVFLLLLSSRLVTVA